MYIHVYLNRTSGSGDLCCLNKFLFLALVAILLRGVEHFEGYMGNIHVKLF